MLLMIDNYDSFTYNLVQYLRAGAEVKVVRNDALTWRRSGAGARAHRDLARPVHARTRPAFRWRCSAQLGARMPILGVCLGHQSLGQAFGGKVVRAKTIMHGKTSPIHHTGKGVFAGLPDAFEATRYHSLVVERDSAARLPGDHRLDRDTRTAASTRSWACATASIRWKACSSIPNRS